jgi:hypothetical protein
MSRYLACMCAALLLIAVSAAAQQKATITGVADISFTPAPNFLKLSASESLDSVSTTQPPEDSCHSGSTRSP